MSDATTAPLSSSRLLAVLLLTAAGALAAAAIVVPIKRSLDVEQRILAHQSAIDALARVAKTDGGLATPGSGDLLVAGETAGRASADLQQRLNAIATAIGLQVRSVQALPVRRQGNILEVPVEVTLQVETNSLAAYLLSIETRVPLIIIDELNIRTLPPVQLMATGVPGGNAAGVKLEVSLKAHGVAVLSDGEKQP